MILKGFLLPFLIKKNCHIWYDIQAITFWNDKTKVHSKGKMNGQVKKKLNY